MHPTGQALLASAGVPPPWTPAVVVPSIWVEGDTIVGGTEAAAIPSWTDASGNNNHLTAAGTAQPTLRTNALNAYPVVEFDGSTDVLTIPNVLTALTAGTLFAVVKLNADPGSGNGLIDIGTDGSLQDHYPYVDGTIYSDFGSTVRKTVGNPTPSMASWHLLSMRSASGAWDCRFNGTSLFTTASNTVGFNAAPKLGNGGGAPLGCRVAMFLINNGALTDAYVEKLEGYAAHKYALQAVLPGGHPWKTVPPPYEAPPTIAVRMGQQYVEVISSGTNNKDRLHQQYVEVVNSGGAGRVRVSQQSIEVITSN